MSSSVGFQSLLFRVLACLTAAIYMYLWELLHYVSKKRLPSARSSREKYIHHASLM